MGIKSKLNKIWDRPSILREAIEDENPLIPKKDPKVTEDPLAPPGDPTAPEIEDPDVPLTAPRTQPGSEIQKPTGPLAGDTTLTDTEPIPEPIPEPVVEPALDETEPAAAQAEQAPAQLTKEDVHEIISNYKEQLDAIFNKDAQASVLKKLGAVVGQIEDENKRNIVQQTLNGIADLGTGLTETLETLRDSIVQGLGIESPRSEAPEPEPEPALDVPQVPDLELEPGQPV